MIYEFTIKTDRQGFYNITPQVAQACKSIGDGICVVFCPHTTAAVTINENSDPDVQHDLLLAFDRVFADSDDFRHAEGNSAAHAKAAAIGNSATVLVRGGKPVLGIWQAVYFCEFDGPRERHFLISTISG